MPIKVPITRECLKEQALSRRRWRPRCPTKTEYAVDAVSLRAMSTRRKVSVDFSRNVAALSRPVAGRSVNDHGCTGSGRPDPPRQSLEDLFHKLILDPNAEAVHPPWGGGGARHLPGGHQVRAGPSRGANYIGGLRPLGSYRALQLDIRETSHPLGPVTQARVVFFPIGATEIMLHTLL
jgi:hypothetical protein